MQVNRAISLCKFMRGIILMLVLSTGVGLCFAPGFVVATFGIPYPTPPGPLLHAALFGWGWGHLMLGFGYAMLTTDLRSTSYTRGCWLIIAAGVLGLGIPTILVDLLDTAALVLDLSLNVVLVGLVLLTLKIRRAIT